MILRPLDRKERPEYDSLVASSNEGTIFHTSWWLECMEASFNVEIPLYGIFENDSLVSAMPVPLKKKLGINVIATPYITPYLGPVFLEHHNTDGYREKSWKKKANAIYADLMRSCGKCLFYPFVYTVTDLMPYKWKHYNIGVTYTYLKDVSNLKIAWEGIYRKRRRAISSCEKNDMTIRNGTPEELYTLHRDSMSRKGNVPMSQSQVDAIADAVTRHHAGTIHSAEIDGATVGSTMLVWDEKRSYGLFGGEAAVGKNAMSMLIWERMRYTNEVLGLPVYDFEGSCHTTIEPFVRSFNGTLTPWYYLQENSVMYLLLQKMVCSYNRMRNPKRY